jgi:hypothetical protein
MRDGRSIEQMGQSSALTGIKTTGQGIKFTQGEELLPTRSAEKAVEPVLIVERRASVTTTDAGARRALSLSHICSGGRPCSSRISGSIPWTAADSGDHSPPSSHC